MTHDDPIAENRALWDELTPIHERSAFYDLDGFRQGRCSLGDLEVRELGDHVTGRRLLHLQCHLGLDTLSWVRRGARATGVDLSPRSIEVARSLARELGLDAEFVAADLYELPAGRWEPFDVVFTSWGVLMWLPDLSGWAEVVASQLRPGGIFYLAEFHPVLRAFASTPTPELGSTYFFRPEPREWGVVGSYADPGGRVRGRSRQWDHPLGDVVTALIGAGLRIEFVHEHARCPEPLRAWLVPDGDGWWTWPGDPLPLSFSIRARRPG